MNPSETFARVARNDCTVYAASTGQYCTKAADHVTSPEPAIRRHAFTEQGTHA